MPHSPADLKSRTKTYALRIIKLYQALPKSGEAQVIGKKFYAVELPLEHNIAKHAEQNPQPIS